MTAPSSSAELRDRLLAVAQEKERRIECRRHRTRDLLGLFSLRGHGHEKGGCPLPNGVRTAEQIRQGCEPIRLDHCAAGRLALF